jgi:hypothetical protein
VARWKDSDSNYLEHNVGLGGHCEELGSPVSKEKSPKARLGVENAKRDGGLG